MPSAVPLLLLLPLVANAYVYNVCEAHVARCIISTSCPADAKCIKSGITGTGGCYCNRGYCAVNGHCVLTKPPTGPARAPSLNLSSWFLDDAEMQAATGGIQRPRMALFSTGSSASFFLEAQSMWRQLYSDIEALSGQGWLYDTSWLLGSRFQLRPELDQVRVRVQVMG